VHGPFWIETDRLLIRPWEPGDDAGFREMVGDPEMMRYISGDRLWDEERIAEFHARQRRHLASRGCCMGALVERATGQLAGVCGLQPMRTSSEIEVGWWVAKRLWGRGFATEGGAAALRFGWEKLGLRRGSTSWIWVRALYQAASCVGVNRNQKKRPYFSCQC